MNTVKGAAKPPSQEYHEETAKLLLKNSGRISSVGTKKPKPSIMRGLESPQSTQQLEIISTPKLETVRTHPVEKKKKKERRIQAAQPEALDYTKTKRLVEEGSTLMGRFRIDGMIAGGGFGQVYLGMDNVTGMKLAIKVQGIQVQPGEKEPEKRIKLEMMLYTRLRGQNHIPLLIAACPLPNQAGIALIMQLVGRSLADVRRQMPNRRFTLGTLFRAMRQVLSAISVIHEVGFLHRDVKPPNCCLGTVDVRRIYLLDFGLCRQYVDCAGMVRKARKEAHFRGTVRYASLLGHAKQEFGPCNDLVAFLYSTVELGNAGLPWSHTAEKDKIEKMKRETTNQKLIQNQPQLLAFTEEVMSMKNNTIPDYGQLMKLFDQFQPAGLTPDASFDWEVNPCELEVKVKRDDHVVTQPTLPPEKTLLIDR